jgi:hypothetical protein
LHDVTKYHQTFYPSDFERLFVADIFDPSDPPPVCPRRGRLFVGALRVVPLAYLAAVDLGTPTPADLSAQVLVERAFIAGDQVPPISVVLTDPPTVTLGRTTLAAARALALDEIAGRTFYP